MSSDRPNLVLAPGRTEGPTNPAIDIVFIHGLGGDRWKTWGDSENSFWPYWLAEDFEGCAFYTAGFDSSKLAGFLTGEGASIRDIATMLAAGLLSLPSRAPRMIIVAHSLGGLVIKQMLRICSDSPNPRYQQLASAVSGVVFLATPHQGSMLASIVTTIFNLAMSKQAKQLQYSSEELIDLQSAFASWAGRAGVDVRPFYETEYTSGVRVVDKVTANPGVAGAEPTAVQTDHFGICKPDSRDAIVYCSVASMIAEHIRAGSGKALEAPLVPTSSTDATLSEVASSDEVAPDILCDYEYYTATAPDDRRDLERKLADAGRGYQFKDANRKKERFNMALQRSIAQPAAVTRYTRLLADVETRFNRHIRRMVAEGADMAAIDQVVESQVIDPCVVKHSTAGGEISAALVDSALYYLAGNCHVGWDDV